MNENIFRRFKKMVFIGSLLLNGCFDSGNSSSESFVVSKQSSSVPEINKISNEVKISSSFKSQSSSSMNKLIPNSQKCEYSLSKNTLTCIEKTYMTVVIGSQIWMAENLNYGTFRSDDSSFLYLTSGQKLCYENDTKHCDDNGGLYQWHTAMGFENICSNGSNSCVNQVDSINHQGICPTGWHIPRNEEFIVLMEELGGELIAGSKMKLANTNYKDWNNIKFNNGNSSGFSGTPAGVRKDEYDGWRKDYFTGRGVYTEFWTIEQSPPSMCFSCNSLRYAESMSLWSDRDRILTYSSLRSSGLSIRCIKNE